MHLINILSNKSYNIQDIVKVLYLIPIAVSCIVNVKAECVPNNLLMLLTLSFCLRHQSSGILSGSQLSTLPDIHRLHSIVWIEMRGHQYVSIKVTIKLKTGYTNCVQGSQIFLSRFSQSAINVCVAEE